MKKIYKPAAIFMLLIPYHLHAQAEFDSGKEVEARKISIDAENANEDEEGKNILKFSGDIRLRAEQDWDSRNFDGTYREDRFRLRHRLRLGFTYNWNKHIGFGAGKWLLFPQRH